MLNGIRRSYAQQPRTGRFLLLSMLLHLLAIVALNLALLPREALRSPQKQGPIRISFIRPPAGEEPRKPEVLAETSSRAQSPEGAKAEVSKQTDTILPKEPQVAVAPTPPSPPHVPNEASSSTIPAPAREAPKPPPKVVSKRPAKRPTAAVRRRERARQAAEPTAPSRPPAMDHTAPQRLAKLPEPAERTPPRPEINRSAPAEPSPEALPQSAPDQPLAFGRIPLLSGDDLAKYAQVRTADRSTSSGNDISLNTKEIKYLSYFAQIKRRIERIWTYPPDAVANGMQGQLYLKFVLLRSGEVKNVELLRSSGFQVLDKEAWDAVLNAGPFGTFPPSIPEDELHITARFTYDLDDSGRGGLLR